MPERGDFKLGDKNIPELLLFGFRGVAFHCPSFSEDCRGIEERGSSVLPIHDSVVSSYSRFLHNEVFCRQYTGVFSEPGKLQSPRMKDGTCFGPAVSR